MPPRTGAAVHFSPFALRPQRTIDTEGDLKRSVVEQVVARMKAAGIRVHGRAEMDAFLKEHGEDSIQSLVQRRKNPSRTWQDLTTPSPEGEVFALSSKDGAKIEKIRQRLSALATDLHGRTSIRGVLTDFANAIGASGKGASKYVTLQMPDGATAVIRISNHNADAATFAENGHPDNNISIVFKHARSGNRFKADDDVELTEYVYTAEAVEKDGDLLSSVAESLSEMLRTGEYVDRSGKAIVNRPPA